MKGYLTDKLDYYAGNYNLYFLKALVAREGGNPSHINLLTYLFSNSFTSKSGPYADLRSLSSLLHLVPSKARIFLSYYLQLEENRLGKNLPLGYQINTATPIEVLTLNADIYSNIVGNRITSLMIGTPTPDMGINLSRLLGLNYVEPSSAFLSDRLDYIYRLVDLTEEDISILGNVFCTRDKAKALTYIATAWGYKENSIRELRGLLYEWKD